MSEMEQDFPVLTKPIPTGPKRKQKGIKFCVRTFFKMSWKENTCNLCCRLTTFENNLIYFLLAMQSSSTFKKFEIRSKSDWYKLTRIEILKLLFISKDIVTGQAKLTRAEYDNLIFSKK